jgi:hypothetical protein
MLADKKDKKSLEAKYNGLMDWNEEHMALCEVYIDWI